MTDTDNILPNNWTEYNHPDDPGTPAWGLPSGAYIKPYHLADNDGYTVIAFPDGDSLGRQAELGEVETLTEAKQLAIDYRTN